MKIEYKLTLDPDAEYSWMKKKYEEEEPENFCCSEMRGDFGYDGYIRFEDIEVYKYLEVPEEIYTKLFPDKEIEKLIETKNADELEKEIEEMPRQMKENVAKKARDMKLDSTSKVKAITKSTGLDVDPNREEKFDD
jgi:hypothetical protein